VTLIRTRGTLQVYLEAVAAALDGFPWAFGLIVVSQEAFAAGAASIPGPLSDGAQDWWFFHQYGFSFAPNATLSNSEGSMNRTVEVDSKSMRKLHVGQNLVGVFETGTEVGTAVVRVSFDCRMLFKLP